MSYSETITRNDLAEILTQLGIGVSFGQMYRADWTATSSSSTPYQVTGSITLSKGKYLAIISIPVCSQETLLYFYLHSLGAQKSIVHGFSQSKYPVLFELTETTTIWVETGMSQSTTYSYLERGGLDVICLSDLKQYGTTVLDYYPVGSYYETSDASFDPNTAWGGTWVLESGGRVHISAGTMENNSTSYWGSDITDWGGHVCDFPIGESGGETKQTLDATEMPSHYHNTQAEFSLRAMSYNGSQPGWGGNGTTFSKITDSAPDTISQQNAQANPYNVKLNKNSDSKGGGQAHNNMQPYIVVNRWHRTA